MTLVVTLKDMASKVYGTAGDDVLTGSSADDQIYGYAGNDTLYGSGGNDLLDGGAGTDYMSGDAGDDTYFVDAATDSAVESSGSGNDTVIASVSYTLLNNVEALVLSGSANLNGTGNASANTLTGNSGNNTLNGGAGVDTMSGGLGNDTYVVDSTSDVVAENPGEGTDLVQASATYTLSSNVENLTLTGSSGINATGNAMSNVLTGNSGANTLSGGAGNDTLDGGAGNDTMLGGLGDDTYTVGAAGDVATESAGQGIDTVMSSVTYTLGANLENLSLTGSSAINATGNSLDNVLTGNSAANVLTGGAGNDTYYVGTGDTVTEAASAGTDTVMSAITWTLGSNIENLTLTGSSVINGTGNTLNNVITGNTASNTLTGAAGNDTLDGGAGADTLVGGTGADIYGFGIGYGVDTIQENDGTANVKDAVQFVGTVKKADALFTHVGNNLEVSIKGTSDKIVVQNWYLGTQYHVEEFRFVDGTIGDTQIQGLASAMASFNSPTSGIASAPVVHRADHRSVGSGGSLETLAHGLVSAMAGFQAPAGGMGSLPSNHVAHNHMIASGITSPALMQ